MTLNFWKLPKVYMYLRKFRTKVYLTFRFMLIFKKSCHLQKGCSKCCNYLLPQFLSCKARFDQEDGRRRKEINKKSQELLQVLQSDWRVQYVFSLVSLHSSYVLRLLLLMQQKCGIWRVSSRVDFRTHTNWIQVLPVEERPVFLTASSAITYICIHNTGNTLYCTVGNFSGQKK